MNFVALKPSISIEKPLRDDFSLEGSFVQGQFNNFFFTDHYDYRGVLMRAKKYFSPVESGAINLYGAIYAGALRRNIQTQGHVDNTGWFSFSSRSFKSQSIRSGGSLGLLYYSKGNILIDGQTSLGYGRYINLDSNDPNTRWKGYLDVQVWLSVGYCIASKR
ncbi:MAG TPA: hypothetical protein VM101_13405 [Flavitalea sp.]|nr:hypothetical protein [Flavitalea sp.]